MKEEDRITPPAIQAVPPASPIRTTRKTTLPLPAVVDDLKEELKEQGLVNEPARRFGVHWIPLAKYVCGPLGAVLIAWIQHSSGKADSDHKTAVGYETLAPATNEHSDEIKELKSHVAQLADSVKALGELSLAGRDGFTVTGKPAPVVPPHHHRAKKPAATLDADPALVKKVQENAVKAEALKEKVKAEAPAAPQVPPTLPSEPPPTTPSPSTTK